jgi:hypothetical protein
MEQRASLFALIIVSQSQPRVCSSIKFDEIPTVVRAFQIPNANQNLDNKEKATW